MKRLLCALFAASAAVCLCAPRSNPIEKIYDSALKVVHFLPGGLHGTNMALKDDYVASVIKKLNS